MCSSVYIVIHAETQKFNVGFFVVYDSFDLMTFTTTLPALAAGINPWEDNQIGKYVRSFQCRWTDRDYGPDLHFTHSLYLGFVFLKGKTLIIFIIK